MCSSDLSEKALAAGFVANSRSQSAMEMAARGAVETVQPEGVDMPTIVRVRYAPRLTLRG